MHIVTRTVGILLAILCVAPVAAPTGPAEAEAGSIRIVFKDGREQTYRLAEIARIEFNSPAERVSAGQGRFMGQWRVGNGIGGTFLITLKPDGVARKTLGSENGMWTVVNGEARIAWDDGWHDCIRKVDNRYQKAAYKPGSSLSGRPENVAEAVYIEAH
jgi:hypothetical protein